MRPASESPGTGWGVSIPNRERDLLRPEAKAAGDVVAQVSIPNRERDLLRLLPVHCAVPCRGEGFNP